MRTPGVLLALLGLALARPAGAGAPEKRVTEAAWEKEWAPVVGRYEAARAIASTEPARALALLEELLDGDTRTAWEGTIVVVYSRGIARGAEASRTEFRPLAEAGRCAEALGRLDLAREYYARSPSSAADLARVERRLHEAKPTPEPPKDRSAELREKIRQLTGRRDFDGALTTASAGRADLGDAWAEAVHEVREAARRFQDAETAAFASSLGEVDRPEFCAKRVEPVLARCAGIPDELVTEQVRWVRSLSAWCAQKSADELDRLSVFAHGFGGGFAMLLRISQEHRVEALERLPAGSAGQRAAGERTAYERLAAVKRFADLDERVARAMKPAKAEESAPDLALERARKITAPTSREIRELYPVLEETWLRRAQRGLGVRESRELAQTVAVFRISKLFLDGSRIETAAADGIVREAVAAAGPAPAGVSPKVAQVWQSARR